jgi:NTP pyrophosphatase (non-canonical NTP hydrolase)
MPYVSQTDIDRLHSRLKFALETLLEAMQKRNKEIPCADLDALLKRVSSLEDELSRMKDSRNKLTDRLRHEEELLSEAVEALLNEESYFETVVRWLHEVGHPVSQRALDLQDDFVDGVQEVQESVELGMRLVMEEHEELTRAWNHVDTAGLADAIADLIWVLCGLAARLGYDLDEVWSEVTRANFDKLGGPKREDGKQLKPEGWKPPDIYSALLRGRDLSKVGR